MKLELRTCTLCGPSATASLKYPATLAEADLNPDIFSARRIPDGKHFQFTECTDCGIIYSSPACSAEELSKLYQSSAVTYDDLEDCIFATYSKVLDKCLPILPRKGLFIEVGGGSGFMLNYATERGFESALEIEPSGDAVSRFQPKNSRHSFLQAVLKPGLIPERSASLICFFQMLDHVPNPREFLDVVLQSLEPGGIAVCVTHNTRALSAKALGEKSPIFDIEHTYLFNPNNLSRLFQSVGFNVVKAFPIRNIYPLHYWLRMLPFSSSTKKRILRVGQLMRLNQLRLQLFAGNFAILAQRPATTSR